MQINPVGHPRLCWQATGDGAPVLLEGCDSARQSQQWSLTPDGVLMNGIGYCLEAGSGQPDGVPLDIDFAGRCGGAPGQVWRHNGKTGQLSSLGTCAALGGPVSPGTEVVRSACPGGPRWSIGYSAVTLTAGTGSGPAGGAFDASVTVANASSAQAAYEVTVAFGLPRGLAATGVRVVGVSGWRCDRHALTCTGTVLAGASGRIGLSGRLPADARPGGSYLLTAQAVVHGTSQLHGRTSAPLTVSVRAVAPVTTRGAGVPLPAIVVAVLLACAVLLVGLTLRRWSVTATDYQGRRRRPAHRPLRRPYPFSGWMPVTLDGSGAQPAGCGHGAKTGTLAAIRCTAWWPAPRAHSSVVEHSPYKRGVRRFKSYCAHNFEYLIRRVIT